jgi:hypothetical protein
VCGEHASCIEPKGCTCQQGYDGDGQSCTACGDQTVAVDVDGETVCAPDYPAWGIRPESPPATWFVDSGDGTIVDTQSKIMWQKGDSGSGKKNWSDAKAYCQGLVLGGKSDWRLPTRFELETIIDFGKVEPAVPVAFLGTASTNYWSVSPVQGWSSGAWSVYATYGYSDESNLGNLYRVRCVR